MVHVERKRTVFERHWFFEGNSTSNGGDTNSARSNEEVVRVIVIYRRGSIESIKHTWMDTFSFQQLVFYMETRRSAEGVD